MSTPAWAVLTITGLIVIATGAVSPGQAREVAVTRGAPVLGFLVAITVLAELSDRAGVFDAAAGVCARAAHGSTLKLFALVAVLATLTTIGMSLDTTAVLLTPVVLTLTAKLRLRPTPFALLVIWLANTASLLLPVSNLTNLLATQRLGLSTAAYATRTALPELVAVTVTVTYLGVRFRRDLTGRFTVSATPPPADPVLFRLCTVACLALAPAVLLGVPPWAAALPCAGVAAVGFVVRREALGVTLIPWRIVLLTEGLFLTVTAVAVNGGSRVLGDIVGGSTLATAVTGAVTGNAVNNLPAYLALEPAVPPGHTTALLGALLGTDGGPLILVYGSLATLLWRDRCRAKGLVVPAWTFARMGLLGVPFVILGSWAALLATS